MARAGSRCAVDAPITPRPRATRGALGQPPTGAGSGRPRRRRRPVVPDPKRNARAPSSAQHRGRLALPKIETTRTASRHPARETIRVAKTTKASLTERRISGSAVSRSPESAGCPPRRSTAPPTTTSSPEVHVAKARLSTSRTRVSFRRSWIDRCTRSSNPDLDDRTSGPAQPPALMTLSYSSLCGIGEWALESDTAEPFRDSTAAQSPQFATMMRRVDGSTTNARAVAPASGEASFRDAAEQ